MSATKSSKKQVDMLSGSLLKNIILFALPLAASSILQQLFNSVDVAVVGHFANSQAQAAVGCNGPVINMVINLFIGISIGANVIISIYVGQKKTENIKKAVHTAMLVAIISGIFLTILGLFISRPLLTLMNTPAEVLDYAVIYLQIYFLGMPFIMVYNFGSAILRCIGDTKRPLYCLLVSGIVNSALNLFLVIVFHLDVSGVAIATVVSNIISACMVWHFLTKEAEPFNLSWKKLSISKNELLKMLKIGIPAGIQSMVFSISNVVIQSALNSFGADVVAGSSVTLNYESITYFVITAFSQTAVTFTSQNYGAGEYDRCKKVFRISMIASMITTGCMSLSITAGHSFFISIFTPDAEVIKYAEIRMFIVLMINLIASTYEVGGAALRGIGYSTTPAVITVLGTCALRLIWVYTVCQQFKSYETLLIIYPISWVITGVAMLTTYFLIRKKTFSKAKSLA